MKRPRIITAAIEISSADVKARVEVKTTNVQRIEQNISFITPNENLPGKCYFMWIFKNDK